MQAKFRYCALLALVLACACVFTLLYGSWRHNSTQEPVELPSALTLQLLHEESGNGADEDYSLSARSGWKGNRSGQNCTMLSCFNYTKCVYGFKVYVYEPEPDIRTSGKYSGILDAIKQSRFYTTDPAKACVFIVAIDTLDRDKLSTEFLNGIGERIWQVPLWNNGINHLVFNLYSGTYPDYDIHDLGFDLGHAMLAQASIAQGAYRPGFDISYPLYHDNHPGKGGEPGYVQTNNVPPVRQHTLSFKGKRYVYGIGSDSRNALYHIHNGKDIVLVTTCKHKGVPKHLYDGRCEEDEQLYDQWDYKVLMHNSTFCLVPRGRRLASYRFLESLQAGCIPVLLSNGYMLPFSEVIDWSRAAVWADERLLLQIPTLVRGVSHTEILAMRQQTQLLWNVYFSSVHKIVLTTLEILADRVARHFSWPVLIAHVWNSYPGSLAVLPEYSPSLSEYPFFPTHQYISHLSPTSPSSSLTSSTHSPYTPLQAAPVVPPIAGTFSGSLPPFPAGTGRAETLRYTAVIVAVTPPTSASSPLPRLLKQLAKSQYLHRILLLWLGGSEPPEVRWNNKDAPHINLIVKSIQSLEERFTPFSEIETHAVLALDDTVTAFNADQADFGFSVWREFAERLVGYTSGGHYWHERRQQWAYSSRATHHYSLVTLPAVFYHKYYGFLLQHGLSGPLLSLALRYQCHELLLNFLVSHVTSKPPIRLLQQTTISEEHIEEVLAQMAAKKAPDAGVVTSNNQSVAGEATDNIAKRVTVDSTEAYFRSRQQCMHELAQEWGSMPLLRSEVRIDPVLYRDDVSILRKRYRQLEQLPSAFAWGEVPEVGVKL